MVKIAIANYKGGSGKTTLSLLLSLHLKSLYRTALIDLDPQGHSTMTLIDPSVITEFKDGRARFKVGIPCILEMVLDHGVEVTSTDVLQNSYVCDGTLFLFPNSVQSVQYELQLMSSIKLPTFVKSLCDCLAQEGIEFCIVDTPPHLGAFLISALAAVDYVIVPVEAHVFATYGLLDMVNFIKEARRGYNPKLELLGIVLVRVNPHTRMWREVYEYVYGNFGSLVFENYLTDTKKIQYAVAKRDLSKKSLGKYYKRVRELCDEVIARIRLREREKVGEVVGL